METAEAAAMAVVMAAAAVLLAAEVMAMMVAMAAMAVAGAAATAVPAAATCGGLVCLSLRLRLLGQQHLLGGKNRAHHRLGLRLRCTARRLRLRLRCTPRRLHLCLCCTAQLMLPRSIRLLVCDDDLQQGRAPIRKGIAACGDLGKYVLWQLPRSSPGGPDGESGAAMVTQIVASIKAGSGSSSRRADPDTRAWLKSRGRH